MSLFVQSKCLKYNFYEYLKYLHLAGLILQIIFEMRIEAVSLL